jgi:hypothetical protein
MAFVAECNFCRLVMRGVPDHRLGSTVECPRCKSSFTLAPVADPEATLARVSHSLSSPAPAEPAAEAPAPTAIATAPRAAPVSTDEPADLDTRPLTSLVEDEPAEEPEPPAAPVQRFPNLPGLAAFLLACFAFLAGWLFQSGLATLAIGLVSLLLAVMGFVFSSLVPSRRILPAFGVAVSLPALLIPVLVPSWLDLPPLGSPPRPTERDGQAAMSLSGTGGLRRVLEGETPWVDASQDALHAGDVRLRISSAVVGSASFAPVPGKVPPGDRCLVIGLRVTNAGVLRKIAYNGWDSGDKDRGRPMLRDDQGKTYAAKTFGPGWVVKGRAGSATIPPGKTLDDVLVFEAPPATVAYLRLELPGAPVGAKGKLQMEIPQHMIAFR